MNIFLSLSGDSWGLLHVWETEDVYGIVVLRPERTSSLGRPMHSWEDNIKMDLQGALWGVMDWIDLAQDRDRWWVLVNAVLNFRVPSKTGNFLIS